ncbi:unnamed protein product [Paramecium sonneborni]|uniref:Uncharacterized protein n=1 Tax=Paramecium sonneborni TaxID=65129 RepID=A0A8S1RFB3_9CILI|nr:unnamed protein product [Paramecium sonneborni]
MNRKDNIVNQDNLQKHYEQKINQYQEIIESQDKKINELQQQIEQQKQQLKELGIKEEQRNNQEEKLEKYKKNIQFLLNRISWQITDQSMNELTQSIINQHYGQYLAQQNEILFNSAYQDLIVGQNVVNQEIFEVFYIIGIEKSYTNTKQYNSKIQYKYYKKEN